MQLSRLALLALALAPAVSSESCAPFIVNLAGCELEALADCALYNNQAYTKVEYSFGASSSVNFCTILECAPGVAFAGDGEICRDAPGEGSPASSTKLATAAIAAAAVAGTVLA
ncbi:hypothetical protein TeGR_g8379 [Tetraparma gracilis]|uniref:Uncharacterized protein n=1 Tax=Tetraparma gracilis TaxID=2962635 RepID=A0ABQ6MIL0_9STRA|nr:hypothetical protein TeGR_g8379 [Tetraparma gracilis]